MMNDTMNIDGMNEAELKAAMKDVLRMESLAFDRRDGRRIAWCEKVLFEIETKLGY